MQHGSLIRLPSCGFLPYHVMRLSLTTSCGFLPYHAVFTPTTQLSSSGARSDCQPCNFVTTMDCKRYKNTFPKMRCSSSLNCKFGPKIVYELVIKNINIVFRSILIFMEFWGENMHYVLFAQLYQRCRVRKEISPHTSQTATL